MPKPTPFTRKYTNGRKVYILEAEQMYSKFIYIIKVLSYHQSSVGFAVDLLVLRSVRDFQWWPLSLKHNPPLPDARNSEQLHRYWWFSRIIKRDHPIFGWETFLGFIKYGLLLARNAAYPDGMCDSPQQQTSRYAAKGRWLFRCLSGDVKGWLLFVKPIKEILMSSFVAVNVKA